MREYSIAVIPADGIGPEVIGAGIDVLKVLAEVHAGIRLNFEVFDWGSEYYKRTGAMMPDDGLERLRKFDAIYFGAVGAVDVPDHVTLWGLRLKICQGFDQYANVRPTRILPGIVSPLNGVGIGDLDWVIVRENSEGEYSGAGGRVHQGLPEEVGMDVSVFTRTGVERIMRYAFGLAQSRPRKLLTVVTKSNAQRHGMVMWDEIAEKVSGAFPDVTWDKMLVDAMTVRMVMKPQSLDTIVATNLHADVLSDLAGALAASAWRQRPTSIPNAATRRCSSRSTVPPSTSRARASPTLSPLSGRPCRCWAISASRKPANGSCAPSSAPAKPAS
jgi:tartrate dehydrogenase/decarboxylase/D-malate dehydrogenase